MHSRKTRAAEIQDAIRQVLLHDWDPIGFSNLLPEDEYDSCIAPVYRILVGTRSERELIECLVRLAGEFLGCPYAAEEPLRPVARRLLELDVRL